MPTALCQSVQRVPTYLFMSTVYCLLPTVYCLLSIVYCLLSTVYCLLSTVYCLLSYNFQKFVHLKKEKYNPYIYIVIICKNIDFFENLGIEGHCRMHFKNLHLNCVIKLCPAFYLAYNVLK